LVDQSCSFRYSGSCLLPDLRCPRFKIIGEAGSCGGGAEGHGVGREAGARFSGGGESQDGTDLDGDEQQQQQQRQQQVHLRKPRASGEQSQQRQGKI